jgi:hypothetical protein
MVFPMRKFDEGQFMRLPPWDQVSILVIESKWRTVFAIISLYSGPDVDPDMKKLRQ